MLEAIRETFEDRRGARWSPKRQAIGWIWGNGNNLDSRRGHRETHGPDPSDDIPDLSWIKRTWWMKQELEFSHGCSLNQDHDHVPA